MQIIQKTRKKFKKEENMFEDDEIKNDGKNDETDTLIDKENDTINDMDNNKKEEKPKKEEKKSEDDEIKNAGKNAGSIKRGIVVKALTEAGVETGAVVARAGISAGLKIAS